MPKKVFLLCFLVLVVKQPILIILKNRALSHQTVIFIHVVYALVGPVNYSFRILFVNNDCVLIFLFPIVLIKRIGKTKNRVKSDLEFAIKIIDSKHVEILSVIKSADSKRKEMESVTQHIGLRHRELRKIFAKQKRLRDIWGFFDRRENDLLKQKIRIIRALNEINLFFIDDDGAEPFDGFTEIFINQIPELYDFDFSQTLKRFDFSSIPIFPFAAFQ